MTVKQLKLLRLFHGLTQKDFAKEIGVSENTIAKIEANYSEVSTATRAKVLRRFDPSDKDFIEFCQRMETQ